MKSLAEALKEHKSQCLNSDGELEDRVRTLENQMTTVNARGTVPIWIAGITIGGIVGAVIVKLVEVIAT